MLIIGLHLPFLELWKADRHGHYHYVKHYYFHSSCYNVQHLNYDFSFPKFKLSTMYGDLFADVVCKQNELC